MITATKRKLVLVGVFAYIVTGVAAGQVSTKGLSPPANTSRSHLEASIARDSDINQPLDLLNDFYPAIEVTVSDHDNVRARPDFDEQDLKTVIRPSLAYRTNVGRHQFYAAYHGTFTSHNKLDKEDASAHALSAKAGLDVSRSWDINVFAGLGESFEERGVSGARPFDPRFDKGPDKVDHQNYGADIIYGKKLGKLVGVFGVERGATSFTADRDNSTIAAGDRDRDFRSAHIDLSYRIGAKTSVFGRYEESEYDYLRGYSSLDSSQTDFIVGLRWKPTNALSGVVGVGKTDKDFDDPALADYAGSNYYANLSYMISPFSVLQLGASRVVEEPGDVQANYYVSDLLSIGWEHALTSQLSFNASAKWVDDTYDTGREDQFFDWTVGFDYAWRDWMNVGVYYGEAERDSSLVSESYDNAFWGIRLRSDLRPLLRGRNNRRSEEDYFRPLNKTSATQ